MLATCRLAGLSALGAHYAGLNGRAQCGAEQRSFQGRADNGGHARRPQFRRRMKGRAGNEAGFPYPVSWASALVWANSLPWSRQRWRLCA